MINIYTVKEPWSSEPLLVTTFSEIYAVYS